MTDPLFRPDSASPEPEVESEEPPAKRARFFSEEAEDVIVLGSPTPTPAPDSPVVGPSRFREVKAAVKSETTVPQSASTWDERYFGDLVVQGYTLYRSSTLSTLKPLEAISLHRVAPAPSAPGKKVKDNLIVRFKNSRGSVIGRINEKDSEWIAKLLDLGVVSFTGICSHVEKNFNSGSSVVLSLTPFISRSAFADANQPKVLPVTTSDAGTKQIPQHLKESPHEQALRERKASLNALFDKTNLQPVRTAGASSSKKITATVSKRTLLEKYSSAMVGQKKPGGEDEEEPELDSNQLSMVYAKAIKNDAFLPEMEPPASFALTLRGYQKQALKWMASTEEGEEDARDAVSLHPLWEEYVFPPEPEKKDHPEKFYYNPYSGDLSLDFPKASKKCGSGILADEMGLGKTIMD